MKQQSFTKEERDAVLEYRMNRAIETLAEADKLIEGQFYNTAVTRLYFACYYSVTALIAKHNISHPTPLGIKRMFSENFINNGKIERKYFFFFIKLFRARTRAEQEDFLLYDYKQCDEYRIKAKSFINAMQTEILKP